MFPGSDRTSCFLIFSDFKTFMIFFFLVARFYLATMHVTFHLINVTAV